MSVRRQTKIEDEDEDFIGSTHDPLGSRMSLAGTATGPNTARASRVNSMRSQLDSSYNNVLFGARVHRASWSTRDFNSYNDSSNRNSRIWSSSGLPTKASDGSLRESSQRRARTPMRGDGGLEIKKSRHGKEKEDVLNERESEEQAEASR